MDVLLPPLGNRPSPLQPQMPVKPERKTHIEPYEAEEDPNFSYFWLNSSRAACAISSGL